MPGRIMIEHAVDDCTALPGAVKRTWTRHAVCELPLPRDGGTDLLPLHLCLLLLIKLIPKSFLLGLQDLVLFVQLLM